MTLTRGFYVGEQEVTQALWQRVMGSNPSADVDCGPRCPVEQVDWLEAIRFANAMSAAEGLEPCYQISSEPIVCGGPGFEFILPPDDCAVSNDSATWPRGVACSGYRLPTAAEWRIAALGGSAGMAAGGGEIDTRDETGWRRVHPVGQRPPNPLGLYDISDNVAEWTWDRNGVAAGEEEAGPTDSRARVDPAGPRDGVARVVLGSPGDPLRGDAAIPSTKRPDLGLRLVRSLGAGGGAAR